MRRLGLFLAVAAASVAALGVPVHALPTAPGKPLEGVVIALDPGHQLGNSNPKFARNLAKTRFNGYIRKGCNTSGTATNSGFPEATFNWKVANYLAERLKANGATVRMTRTTNSWNDWGPCTWDRAAFGAKVDADFMVSIHADGSTSSGRGFFVIAPGRLPGYTNDIYSGSQKLAKSLIAGMSQAGAQKANYISTLLTWKDQTTLNMADVPTVIVELGNMRNRQDAARMQSAAGQREYARWLEAGILEYAG